MLFAVDNELMNRGVKSFLHLSDVARELDHAAAIQRLADLKTVRFKPRGDAPNILLGSTKLAAEFGGGEPLVIVWRGLVLLLGHKLFERSLLRWAALENQLHAVRREVSWRGAAIELRAGQRVRVAMQHHEFCFVHRLRDLRPDDAGLRGRAHGEE